MVGHSWNENKILQANQNLVDGGLVQVMKQVAKMNGKMGKLNTQWLKNFATILDTNLGKISVSVFRKYI